MPHSGVERHRVVGFTADPRSGPSPPSCSTSSRTSCASRRLGARITHRRQQEPRLQIRLVVHLRPPSRRDVAGAKQLIEARWPPCGGGRSLSSAATYMWAADQMGRHKRATGDVTVKDAMIVGCVQDPACSPRLLALRRHISTALIRPGGGGGKKKKNLDGSRHPALLLLGIPATDRRRTVFLTKQRDASAPRRAPPRWLWGTRCRSWSRSIDRLLLKRAKHPSNSVVVYGYS